MQETFSTHENFNTSTPSLGPELAIGLLTVQRVDKPTVLDNAKVSLKNTLWRVAVTYVT
jgi:hypothetical protein